MTNIDTDAPGFLGHPTNDSKRLQIIWTISDRDIAAMQRLETLFDTCRDLNAHIMISGPTTKYAAEVLELWAMKHGITLERERVDPRPGSLDPRAYVTFRAAAVNVTGSYCISVLAAVYL